MLNKWATSEWTTSGSSEPHAPSYKTEEARRANEDPGVDEEQQKLESTPSSEADAKKQDPFADLRASHEDLSELSEANLAEYTSLVVTYMRAAESKRNDAIINDPYAELLSGDAGAAMLSFFSKWSPYQNQLADYIALRTRTIDDALRDRPETIQQVVILGAGLDSRAYRLESLADCHVIEIDSSKAMMERKQKLLDDAGARVLAEQHHVIIADLAQDIWQTDLIAKGFNPKQPTFWLVEGLLYYMTRDDNVRLVKTLDALSPPGSQLWADISGFKTVKAGGALDEREGIFRTRVLKYGEDDPTQGVVALLKWDMEIVDLGKPGTLFGRQWGPMKWARKTETGEQDEDVVPYFFVKATKPQEPKDASLL